MKTILVVGGDGFCGWPAALHLSNKGHKVIIVDNLSRRSIDNELGTQSLVPIASIQRRIKTWNGLGLKEAEKRPFLEFQNIDVATNPEKFKQCVKEYHPDVIVHLGEQRSAPYSMSSRERSQYTITNNISATHNILSTVAECDRNIHIVHLGTMGVYGYGAIDNEVIPEGYVDVTMQGQDINILHPAYPGSVYHMSKAQDALMFQFYAKNYGIRITDLHQGIIWGTQTSLTRQHPDLFNRVDYDETYGTVLNRFLVQRVNNIPVTVYGTGGQTRAFIHVENSAHCIGFAVENPPKAGERPCIFNQMTQTISVLELANLVTKGEPAGVKFYDNPRKELVKNNLFVTNKKFMDLGLKDLQILIDENTITELLEEIKKYNTTSFSTERIFPMSKWT